MSRMTRSLFLAVSLVASPCLAHTSMYVTSDHEAKVYVGKEYAGEAPIQLDAIQAGTQTIKVKSLETGAVKSFTVNSPKSVTLTKALDVAFDDPIRPGMNEVLDLRQAEALRLEASARAERHAFAPVPKAVTVIHARPHAVAPAPVIAVVPVAPAVQAKPSEKSDNQGSHKLRNVLLGAGLVNEVFNKSKSKGMLRKGVVGAAIVNEIARAANKGPSQN